MQLRADFDKYKTAEYRALPDLSLLEEKMISLAHPVMNIMR